MKIKNKKIIINFFKNLPEKIALHSFFAFIGLFILTLGIGGVVFYNYNTQKETFEVQHIEKKVRFQEDTYKKTLDYWRKMEENLRNIESQHYNNPFLGKVFFVATSTTPGIPTSTAEEGSKEKLQKEPSAEIQRLLTAKSIFEFYLLKGEKVPYLWQRAKMWEEKGLGLEDEYKGTKYQNMLLLEKLKEELTP